MLQQGKKMHKKKTSVKKGEKSPIFNEAIIFSVPAHALQVSISFYLLTIRTVAHGICMCQLYVFVLVYLKFGQVR